MIRSTIYTKSISTNIIVIQWRTTIGTISIFSISLNHLSYLHILFLKYVQIRL